MMATQIPHGKQSPWPRCRWCHNEIKPGPLDTTFDTPKETWLHVTSLQGKCEERDNLAEPVPALQEEPFIAAVYEFVDKHRKLRRAFREVSQSRASAMRRLNDYHELVDKLIDALEQDLTSEERPENVIAAARELSVYRKSTQAAGWR
jgi:hypothetical protein